ncbi:DUF1206 domain-containing protein [Sphingomonas sp. H160509]|uniref:DUF1206 domain-containing protein n=1 Tax=Sphingomonas sp. H160509 TaxID=2955313 RepID=UPI0020981E71|nr:DUF1206 domain-containing protein [Sphingomonas sp. H160509]MDD1451817.1 DUF1206 domain-containing protein [Sphingomonas sp. H160509]
MISDANATLLAKLGFAARGVVYILVGWFAVDAALRGGKIADNQGAIGSMADEAFGPVLLAIVAAGLLGYAVWRLTEAAANPEQIGSDVKGSLKRIGHVVSGIAHLILAWTAAKLAMRTGSRDAAVSPGDESARDWTALLLDQPAGRVLVGAVAVGVLVAALQQAQKAWRGDFIHDLRGDAPAPGYVCTMGRDRLRRAGARVPDRRRAVRIGCMDRTCQRRGRRGRGTGTAAIATGRQVAAGADRDRAGAVRCVQPGRGALPPDPCRPAGYRLELSSLPCPLPAKARGSAMAFVTFAPALVEERE